MSVNFSSMTMPQLVSFYNRHSPTKTVKRFSDRKTAEKRCSELFSSLTNANTAKVMHQQPPPGRLSVRPAMQSSLRLDRSIMCVETGEQWKNAHRMWCEHPDWMSSGQQDRLTAQLYAAAKNGERLVVPINGRSFRLVNVAAQQEAA